MNQFSVFNYENLSEAHKAKFNKALAQKLTSFLNELKNDDVLGALPIEEFVASSGAKAAAVVSEIYPKATAGIQAGSGNQNLFQSVLSAFAECWEEINMQ